MLLLTKYELDAVIQVPCICTVKKNDRPASIFAFSNIKRSLSIDYTTDFRIFKASKVEFLNMYVLAQLPLAIHHAEE
jgi:hypothetical protein